MATATHTNRMESKVVEEIARRLLGIETIETRNSDSLDFHDLAVWQVRDALQAAYDAGRAGRQVTANDGERP
jgi:hypothetical protein